jgi:phosphoribosyl 1,2-cyclic phosphodiesterase
MIRVTVLGSGSRGNAIVVEAAGHRLLVDAGFAPRALARRLEAANIAPESIDALLLTHEHTDHASGAAAAIARWNWPLYSTAGTLGALSLPEGCAVTALAVGMHRAIGPLDVLPLRVPHDAQEPVALVFAEARSGARAAVVLDLGHVPSSFATMIGPLDVLVVEANHDAQRLADGPYPAMLKRRIGGTSGHLSNTQCAALVTECAEQGLGAVVLAHLSETNNTPSLALDTVRMALRGTRWKGRGLHVALQSEVLHPVGSARLDARQLSLNLFGD